MAKTKTRKSASRKKRRQRQPNIPKQTGPIDRPLATQEKVAKTKAKPTPAAKQPPVDFATEYHYVVTDLRNMFIVTGVMVILLFVLNYLAI